VFHLKQDGNKKRYFLLGNSGDPTKDRAYNPREWRELYLGKVDEWTLTSRDKSGGHPFHIHVNPFQVVRIENAAGDDVSVTGEPEKADMQYANLQGTWKDTIFVKEGYKIVIRTRYERFNGQFVLHCHILNHEDRGMMENVRIVDPANRDAPENFLPEVEMGMAKGSHH
jgi:FtsP/CotA-like multicopper oxidase with cupredoxin domain